MWNFNLNFSQVFNGTHEEDYHRDLEMSRKQIVILDTWSDVEDI